MESILMSCEKISIKVVEKLIIQKISLAVDKSQIVGLLGPNGAGKTTTFYAIAGIVKINSGKIVFKGNEIPPIKHPPDPSTENLELPVLSNT